ncbi:MAG: DUF502 domain-containing protein [Candidatus Eisenbacteria bacterium]|uniref:DUF502 domain-containing protein n=1 Tax=Eiseniibacteriota bacterium TaxID=2212470 RepID=A0A948RY19_UNCEI|nr:DUF502 domain-containing protein [Candidatus Eisenbacteria bacterium]MBU1950509.1 DUF502 domain-containing protein [Candidatus Eisenbacteria bacterium]MBU2691182.1 DUF502 domain-containing protein [Candidatus Eisenbacteria bacterium]
MKVFLGRLRSRFLAGALFIVPLVVTILVLQYIFRTLDQFLGPVAAEILGRQIPGVGILATIGLVFLVGVFVTNLLGRRLFHLVERLMTSLPMAGSIYKGSRDILMAVAAPERKRFRDVVMLEYPSEGKFSYGFVTSYMTREMLGGSESIANIFIPSAPLPTSGPLVAVRVEDLMYLDMSIDDALKMIVSGGIVTPKIIRIREHPLDGDME